MTSQGQADTQTSCVVRPAAALGPVDSMAPVHRGMKDAARVTPVRYIVAALLIGSAFLKALSPNEAAALAVGYSIPPLFTAVVVQLELLLGVMLLWGCRQGLTLRLTFGVFSLFAIFSLYRALAGFESCGCFGALRVNPWVTFAIDLGVLGALWFAIQHGRAGRGHELAGGRWKLVALTYLAFAAPAMALSLWMGPRTLGVGNSRLDQGTVVVLEPETWIGGAFPLTPFLSPEVKLDEGMWTVLMYHHDCPKCQQAIPQYVALAEDAPRSTEGILLIEVPPYAIDPRPVGAARHVKLSAEREWFVEAPVEIRLEGNLVTAASLDLPRVNASRERGP